MLRSQGCVVHFAIRSWAGVLTNAQSSLSSLVATSASESTCESSSYSAQYLTKIALDHTSRCNASTNCGSLLSWAGPRHTASFSSTSTAFEAVPATSAARPIAERTLLATPEDLPLKARATLADERRDSGAGGRSRQPPPPASTSDPGISPGSASTATAAYSSGMGLDDAEVQAVLDKMVGGLTKSGRKGVARRIVLQAIRVMRQHLKKGDLEELK